MQFSVLQSTHREPSAEEMEHEKTANWDGSETSVSGSPTVRNISAMTWSRTAQCQLSGPEGLHCEKCVPPLPFTHLAFKHPDLCLSRSDLKNLLIGTVDKMQGERAAAGIFSLAFSSKDYVAAQTERLLSVKPWNVAFSWPMACAIVIDVVYALLTAMRKMTSQHKSAFLLFLPIQI